MSSFFFGMAMSSIQSDLAGSQQLGGELASNRFALIFLRSNAFFFF
jgi:hypothetical protein